MEVYYLGGGTCCGKSTVSETLVDKHSLRLFKLDDYIFAYLERLAAAGNPIAQKQSVQSMQEMWLGAQPADMCTEELQLYAAMLPMALQDIAAMGTGAPVLAEGVGFLPAALHEAGVAADRYACVVPTAEFREAQYARRPWIGQFLEGVEDADAAFRNWMRRDALFSQVVLADARRLGYPAYVVDGSRDVDETVAFVEAAFGLL